MVLGWGGLVVRQIAWTLKPKLAASQRSGVKRRSCCSRARLRGPPPNTGTPNFHTLSQTFTGKVLSLRAHTGELSSMSSVMVECTLLKRSEWLHKWNERRVLLLPSVDGGPPQLQWEGGAKITESSRLVLDESTSMFIDLDGDLVINSALTGKHLGKHREIRFRNRPGEQATQSLLASIRQTVRTFTAVPAPSS